MKKYSFAAKASITIITVSIPVFITDQYFHIAKLPRNNARVMLLSGGSLDSTSLGIRQYTPSSTLRHSAIYGDAIEYSYVFKTDKNGFRITYECDTKSKSSSMTAIAGDSFTEGQGSNLSWIKTVQEHLCNQGYNSANTSIAGHGLEEMKDSLEFAHDRLGAGKAIVAIITDDIYRPRTRMISNSTCSMYESKECGDSATWWHHPEGFTPRDMINFASSKRDFGIIPALNILMNKSRSSLKRLIGYSDNNVMMINRSVYAMNSIASRYGAKNVSLYILPTKNDRNLGGSPADKIRRRADLQTFLGSIHKDIRVKDLRDCPLDTRHFFRIDGHPNEKGHRQLGICASQ